MAVAKDLDTVNEYLTNGGTLASIAIVEDIAGNYLAFTFEGGETPIELKIIGVEDGDTRVTEL